MKRLIRPYAIALIDTLESHEDLIVEAIDTIVGGATFGVLLLCAWWCVYMLAP